MVASVNLVTVAEKPRHKIRYLTPAEVDLLCKSARPARTGRRIVLAVRDELLIRFSYNHGLRVSETARFLWEDINLDLRQVTVIRAKGSVNSTHPLYDSEIRLLKRGKTIQPPNTFHVFTHMDGSPLLLEGIKRIVVTAGRRAGLNRKVSSHMLRHACGYRLINDGIDIRVIQQYLGHKNIVHTARYTQLSPKAFTRFSF
jgi:type 1 fimbriae regulatory protein FimB/type 1 fimbriae regulatory protein FimE